jgi:hypothetical protein
MTLDEISAVLKVMGVSLRFTKVQAQVVLVTETENVGAYMYTQGETYEEVCANIVRDIQYRLRTGLLK